MIGKSLGLALVALGIAGCASVPLGDAATDAALKQFSARPEVAGVYIYCDQWMGAGQRTDVEIDGKAFGQNTSWTYLHVELIPGRHSVTVKAENTDTLDFDAEANRNHYVRQEVKIGWFSPRTELHLVSEVEGRRGVNSARVAAPTYRTDDQGGAKTGAAVGGIGAILSIVLSIVAGIAALAP